MKLRMMIFHSSRNDGAPSVLVEKFPRGDEFVKVFQKLAQYLGKEKLQAPIQWKQVGSIR